MQKTKKLTFNKTGKTMMPKLAIPTKWAEYLGITAEEPLAELELENNCLIIRKAVVEDGQ